MVISSFRLDVRTRSTQGPAFLCLMEYRPTTLRRRRIVLVQAEGLEAFRREIDRLRTELKEIGREAELRWARHEAELYRLEIEERQPR